MTQSKTLTVQEALNELKVLDKRIERKLGDTKYVGVVQEDKLVYPASSKGDKDKFISDAKSSIDSFLDLIAYRHALKAGVLRSNALTEVVIGDKKMTVAEAIDYKTSIQSEKDLVQTLVNDLTQATTKATRINEDIDKTLEKKQNSLLSSDKDDKNPDIIKFLKEQAESEKATVLELEVGKSLVSDYTKAKLDSIEQFEQTVDFKLTASNVSTEITVEW